MKILNLYAGIGGNRKLWGNEHEVTAVENVPHVAEVYRLFYPEDTVVEADAHQFLLDHFTEFDFIWSSPPCPTHSRLNIPLHSQGYVRYPEMGLYQEILFLKQWGGRNGRRWVIENVRPYYKPFIQPRTEIERHLFWSNFHIPFLKLQSPKALLRNSSAALERDLGITLPDTLANNYQKRLMLRDITRPEIGAHILKASQAQIKQEVLL